MTTPKPDHVTDDLQDGSTSETLSDVFALLGLVADTPDGRERSADFTIAAEAYAFAMLAGQLFEFCCKLAAPALTAPLDDAEESSAVVDAGLSLGLFDAIKALAALAPGSVQLEPEFLAELHEARKRRNQLAHAWVWDGPLRVVAGEGDDVTAELRADADRFADLINELVARLLSSAVGARGIGVDELLTAADVVGVQAALNPDLSRGLRLPEDALELFQRSANAIDNEGPSSKPD